MGRPRKTGQLHIYRIKLRLWEGEDDDLIAFLQAIPERQLALRVKMALRNGQMALPPAADLFAEDDDLADFALDVLL